MNAKKNTIMNPSDFYSKKKYKIKLSKYKTEDASLNQKLDDLQVHLDNGFILYSTRIMERFLLGHTDIKNFADQFILLEDYYTKNNKFSNTEEQYILQYGYKIGKERWREKIDKVTGENNPWTNHGGKYSPWKKGSYTYSEEAVKKANKNRSYNTQLEYYIDKGLDHNEALVALKERQVTFSLNKCIEKYGKEDGIRIWKERQEKWQRTLKKKTPEQIKRINMMKSSGIGRYLDRNVKCSLYYIHFSTDHTDFWKIGITSNRIDERFNFDKLEYDHNIYKEVLFIEEYETAQEAYKAEQHILATFNKERVIIDIDGFYSTECFSTDVLKGYYNEII